MADPRLPILLVALDIDGTLVGEDLVVGGRTKAAVAEATRRGIVVSLVTGRMASSALPFARALTLGGTIVAMQGAVVRRIPPEASSGIGRLLYHQPIPPEVGREVVSWARQRGLRAHFNAVERMVIEAGEPDLAAYRLFVGGRLTVVPDLLAWAGRPVTKVVAVSEEAHPLELLDEARERFAGRAEVTLSHPRFLEFLAPGISKGRAIRWLARRLRIPLEQTLAIGDQYNDLEMISEVGHGVAMPTAPEAVRAAGRYVAPPVAEEGAAQMIELLALDGARLDSAGLDAGELTRR